MCNAQHILVLGSWLLVLKIILFFNSNNLFIFDPHFGKFVPFRGNSKGKQV